MGVIEMKKIRQITSRDIRYDYDFNTKKYSTFEGYGRGPFRDSILLGDTKYLSALFRAPILTRKRKGGRK